MNSKEIAQGEMSSAQHVFDNHGGDYSNGRG